MEAQKEAPHDPSINQNTKYHEASKKRHHLPTSTQTDTICGIGKDKKLIKGIEKKTEQRKDHTTPLKITQWNARSLQSEAKVNFIRSLPGDLVAIQEIWGHAENIQKVGSIISCSKREERRGGGTSTIHRLHHHPFILERLQLNKDSNAIKIKINGLYMWFINCYLARGSTTKLQRLFARLRKGIPMNEWGIICLIGDFNIDIQGQSNECQLFKSLCKTMGLTIQIPSYPTRETTTIDFLVTGSTISSSNHQIYPSLSDHKALSWDITIHTLKERKPLRIPNKETAKKITKSLLCNRKIRSTEEFIKELTHLRKKNSRHLTRLVTKRKQGNQDLMDALLKSENSQQTEVMIYKYWKRFWKNKENIRFSQASKHAYQIIKGVLKYHLFEKRDGGIISSIQREDGEITTDQKEVEALLLQTLREIQVDEKWGSIEKKEFPRLRDLSPTEMETTLENLSTNKAIAWDGVSDLLFDPQKKGKSQTSFLEITARKLKDLWRTNLDQFQNMEDTWATRLVPLNKVFPQHPTRFQLRPIMIQSTIVKALEARFLSKLQDYLTFRLDRSQTGFVKNMGIQVNLTRAMERITTRTKAGRSIFGLFIDFSHAYNSIPHTLLFTKLRQKNILLEEEVNYLEQLYERYRIKVGSSTLKTNKGVAQGSTISPALFNIFIEDLSAELESAADLHMEDRLFYADDVLLFTSSIQQTRKAIEVVEDWAARNGMNMNKKKSGIVIFASRRTSKIPLMQNTQKKTKNKRPTSKTSWNPTQRDIHGIPICEKYKYLGTWLDSKLTCGPQLQHIKKKAAHLFAKLYPYLASASSDARRDMWQTMVAPIFNAAYVLLEYEPSESHKRDLERTQRITFKQFLMISKKTNTTLINDMMRKDLRTISRAVVATSKGQWIERKACQAITTQLPCLSETNGLRGVPNNWCELINTMVKPCPDCNIKGTVTSRWHLLTKHKIWLPHVNYVWKQNILPITQEEVRKTIDGKKGRITVTRPRDRESIRATLKPLIQKHIESYYAVWSILIPKNK